MAQTPRSVHVDVTTLPIYDRVVIGDYTPRDVVDEVVQMLGFDLACVLSVSITSGGEVAVVTRDHVEGASPGSPRVRTLHRSVIR